MTAAALNGLVLAGGESTRMRTDKAAIDYHGRPQLHHTFELASAVCERTFISVRASQAADSVRRNLPQIVDSVAAEGPLAGILSALQSDPQRAWLVLACDLPFIDRATLDHLLASRDPDKLATAYRSAHDGLPEPLCAIFEPAALEPMQRFADEGRHCPRKFLIGSNAQLLDLPFRGALDNVNTSEERNAALRTLAR